MAHAIRGFIAPYDVLRARTAHLRETRPARLEQGLGFLAATDELYGALGGEPVFEDAFCYLTTGLARVGAWISRGGAAAYVETDYFGGDGEQAAVAWRDGKLASWPEKASIGPISGVLTRYLGAEKGDAYDAFDAVGLGRFRGNERWVKEAEIETPPVDGEPPPSSPELDATTGIPDRLIADHRIAGFVASIYVLRRGTGHLRGAVVAPLEQGAGFLPVTDALRDEVGDAQPAHEELRALTRGLAALGARLSKADSVIYVETDYAGGDGEERALVWHTGDVVMGPSADRLNAISEVLYWIDVERGAAYDEFEAVGLHRHRSNEAWIAAARASRR